MKLQDKHRLRQTNFLHGDLFGPIQIVFVSTNSLLHTYGAVPLAEELLAQPHEVVVGPNARERSWAIITRIVGTVFLLFDLCKFIYLYYSICARWLGCLQ